MNYELKNAVATITIDDGKANVVGPGFLQAMNELLDRAEGDGAGAVILRGRPGMFSAGFDLGEFKKGPDAAMALVGGGMKLLIRLYALPLPLVAACTGHGIAMGAFLLMACDTRIGTRGAYKFTLPETAIGMEVPATMLELAASRIPKQYLSRAVIQSEVFDPDQAVPAGFLDEVVDAAALDARVEAVAATLAQLPRTPYAANKRASRKQTLEAMTTAFEQAIAHAS